MFVVFKYTNTKQNFLKSITIYYVWAIFVKHFSTDDMKKTGLYEHVYDFSVNYDNINVDNILNIQTHLMNKYNRN